MSERSDDGGRAASGGPRHILVTAASGASAEGWAVTHDLVIVLSADLGPDPLVAAGLSVTCGGRTVRPIATHRQAVDPADGRHWTALVLPAGSLPLDEGHRPSGLETSALSPRRPGTGAQGKGAPSDTDRHGQVQGGGGWWCNFFPKAPGC